MLCIRSRHESKCQVVALIAQWRRIRQNIPGARSDPDLRIPPKMTPAVAMAKTYLWSYFYALSVRNFRSNPPIKQTDKANVKIHWLSHERIIIVRRFFLQ